MQEILVISTLMVLLAYRRREEKDKKNLINCSRKGEANFVAFPRNRKESLRIVVTLDISPSIQDPRSDWQRSFLP